MGFYSLKRLIKYNMTTVDVAFPKQESLRGAEEKRKENEKADSY